MSDGGRGAGRLNVSLEPLFGITPFVALRAAATADLTLTLVFQDVPGATVTLTHPGVWVVIGVFDFDGEVNDTLGLGQLTVAGVAEAAQSAASLPDTQLVTASQVWLVLKTTLGPTVLKLQGRKVSGTGTSRTRAGHTTLTALTVPGSQDLTAFG